MRTGFLTALAFIAVSCFIMLSASVSDGAEEEEDDSGTIIYDDEDTGKHLAYEIVDKSSLTARFAFASYEDYNETHDIVLKDSITCKSVEYSVIEIAPYALVGMKVGKLTIPESISGNPEAMDPLRGLGFISIESVELASSHPYFKYEGGALIFNNKFIVAATAEMPNDYTIGPDLQLADGSFRGCENLESVTLSSTMYIIPDAAFEDCANLVTVNFKDQIISIEGEAFKNCPKLTDIALPYSLKYISDAAFYGCSSLTSIEFPYAVSFIASGAFAYCTGLTQFVCDFNPVFTSVDGVLYKMKEDKPNVLVAYPCNKSGKTYIFPDTVVSGEPEAFRGAVNLEKVILNNSMVEVSDSLFYDCSTLKEVVLGRDTTVILSMAFANCESLEKIVFKNNLSTIYAYAFHNCTSLTSVTLPDNVLRMEASVFNGCTALRDVTLGQNTAYIGFWCFGDCTALKEVNVLNTKTVFEEGSLCCGKEGSEASLTVHADKGFSLNANTYNEFTHVDVQINGERPYPYENWIGVIICILIIIGITRVLGRF